MQNPSEAHLLSGDFTLFGFTRNPAALLPQLSVKLGITPKIIDIGLQGKAFFYCSDGEMADSPEEVVIKLGFLRSTTKSMLNARQLLESKMVNPDAIFSEGFSGNGLVVGMSKLEPVFSAFQTLMSVPQLYFFNSEDGIICSDVLRCLALLIPQCEVDESVLPQHYLFRSVYGSSTYIKGVKRLIPGQFMKWENGRAAFKLARSLDAITDEAQYIRNDAKALNLLAESLQDVTADYVTQIQSRGQEMATLLSGGVDSSLVQYYINQKLHPENYRSVSFAIGVSSFDFEVEYARQASEIFNTHHSFANYSPQDYPDLLVRVIDQLMQPPNLETEPSFLAVADYICSQGWRERYFFTGQGGDTLFGGEAATKLKGLEYVRKIPFASGLLKRTGRILSPFTGHAHALLRGAEIIESEWDADAYFSPENNVCVYVLDQNWDILRRCFGDAVLRQTLAERRELIAQISKSRHYLDKVYFIDLTTDLWELAVQRRSIFLAHHLDQATPYFDEDLIKVALSFHPDIRYLKGFKYKYLLRQLLEEKTKAPVARKRKGPSTVNDDFESWMKSGPLRPLVEAMDRPGFINQADFDRLKRQGDYFLWPFLTHDIFQKRLKLSL